eukprot:scaffold281864_cov47-Prasinocladus_malaysianus.AAC.1
MMSSVFTVMLLFVCWVWDLAKTQAAQAARDQQMEVLLSLLQASLSCHLTKDSECPSRLDELEAKTEQVKVPLSTCKSQGQLQLTLHLNVVQEYLETFEASSLYRSLLPVDTGVTEIGQSCLIPLLIRELSLASFSDMSV